MPPQHPDDLPPHPDLPDVVRNVPGLSGYSEFGDVPGPRVGQPVNRPPTPLQVIQTVLVTAIVCALIGYAIHAFA